MCNEFLICFGITFDPVNGQYSVSGQIDFSNPPSSGTLTVTSSCGGFKLNAPFNSPINYNIPNLNASGGSCTVTATFSQNPTCTSTQTYTAPAICCTTNTIAIAVMDYNPNAGLQWE